MKDQEVLKKLRELSTLEEYEARKYIENWINSLLTSIATECAEDIGMGSSMKSIKKIISSNKKKHPEWAYVIRSSKKACVVTDGTMAIKFRNDIGLPATSLQKDCADAVLASIERWARECKTPVTPPSRAELDYRIKDWKSMPKKGKIQTPVYYFGDDGPRVSAKKLMDILPVFPNNICWICKEYGRRSPVYFKWEVYEGILLPL